MTTIVLESQLLSKAIIKQDMTALLALLVAFIKQSPWSLSKQNERDACWTILPPYEAEILWVGS